MNLAFLGANPQSRRGPRKSLYGRCAPQSRGLISFALILDIVVTNFPNPKVSALSALSQRVKLVTLVLVAENLICCGPLLHLSSFAFPSAFQISETITQVFTAQSPQIDIS